jgi:hypothetical protein
MILVNPIGDSGHGSIDHDSIVVMAVVGDSSVHSYLSFLEFSHRSLLDNNPNANDNENENENDRLARHKGRFSTKMSEKSHDHPHLSQTFNLSCSHLLFPFRLRLTQGFAIITSQ